MNLHQEDGDFDSFLKKVEQVESLVRGINSEDDNLVKESLAKADKLIKNNNNSGDVEEVEGIRTKTGVNRTLINKSQDNSDQAANRAPPEPSCGNDQAAFMSVLERDASERRERRKVNTKQATELKEKGNAEFQAGNYEKAIEFYSKGLLKIKDMTILYTNRAQALIKLERYKEAVSDCEWALRVDENCIKALIHKGRALTYLKEFDKAIGDFEMVRKLDAKQSSLVDDYVKELERCRRADNQEKAAQLFLSDESVKEGDYFLFILSTKLNVRDQSLWYYSGGIRCLSSLCIDETRRTLFRTQNGFKLFEEHHIASTYLDDSICIENLNMTELDLISSCFELMHDVCVNCDENVRSLFKMSKFSKIIENFLLELGSIVNESSSESMKTAEFSIVKLLLMLSSNEFGRQHIKDGFNVAHVTQCVVEFNLAEKEALIKEKMLNILENLVLDAKFQAKLKPEDVKNICNGLTKCLKSNKRYSVKAKSLILTNLYALTSQACFRNEIINSESVWCETFVVFKSLSDQTKLDEMNEILLKVVASLLVNICSTKSKSIEEYAVKIGKSVLKIISLERNQGLALSLLGNIVQKAVSGKTILHDFDKAFLKILIENVKKSNNSSQSVKVLALYTQCDAKFCEKVLEIDPSLSFLHSIFKDVSQTSSSDSSNKDLNIKNLNEMLINNSVLCMSHCVENSDKLAQKLTSTNIMMDLLYLTRDGFNSEMQKNCGILISKLVKKDERHLNKLRELNGVEILYAALKNKI